jgi:hypothetical protein
MLNEYVIFARVSDGQGGKKRGKLLKDGRGEEFVEGRDDVLVRNAKIIAENGGAKEVEIILDPFGK